jgi:hypothetical protein
MPPEDTLSSPRRALQPHAGLLKRLSREAFGDAAAVEAGGVLVCANERLDRLRYREKGGNYFDQFNPERTKRKLMARAGADGNRHYSAALDFRPDPAAIGTPPSARRRGRLCKCVEPEIDGKHRQ